MGKKKARRTKKDKVIAQLRRKVSGSEFRWEEREKIGQQLKKVSKVTKKENFLAYDSGLLIGDLRKTALMSLVVLIIELGLWIYFK